MLVFDAHLDLSLNALQYNRDLRQSVDQIRAAESGMVDLGGRGRGTVSFPAMRSAGIGICVATQLAGCMVPPGPVGAWKSPEQAWAMTQGQWAWYQAMEKDGQLVQLTTWREVEEHLVRWNQDPANSPIGYVLSLEGADSIRDLDDLHHAYRLGLRAIGPAHYGNGRYAPGHDRVGPLESIGRDLIREADQLRMILDVTHLSEPSFWEALDLFSGPVWASHHNCRALVDNPRQLSDRQIVALADRAAVIGIAFDVWMVVPDWKPGVTTHAQRDGADLAALADHVDHVCQLLGTVRHTGIGTDLDGGFGNEQTPGDLDTIADLPKFFQILRHRGYSDDDIAAISHGNFLNALRGAWNGSDTSR